MRSISNGLESAARSESENGNGNARGGATSPAGKRLSRPFEALMVPHKTIKKICCIGAGYVGE